MNTIRINNEGVAVDHGYLARPMSTCPLHTKVQLIGAGGCATYGTYDGLSDFWQGWAPLPKLPKRNGTTGGAGNHVEFDIAFPSGRFTFFHGVMGAGKYARMLALADALRASGSPFFLFTAEIDDRFRRALMSTNRRERSLPHPAFVFDENTDFTSPPADVQPRTLYLIDEAHFLTVAQVQQLLSLLQDDSRRVSVYAFGLDRDFKGRHFPASAAMRMSADTVIEIPHNCSCGKPAKLNLRLDAEDKATTDGALFLVAGDQSYRALHRESGYAYRAVCRSCYEVATETAPPNDLSKA